MSYVPVICPSYKRATGTHTQRLIPDAEFAVHEFEADEYQEAGLNVLVVPDDLRGNIARVRNWIVEHGVKEHGGRFLIVDDDVEQFVEFRMIDGKWMPYKLSPDEFDEWLECAYILAEQWGVVAFGVNVGCPDKGSYREYTPFGTLHYVSGSFTGFVRDPICRYDENLPLKEDYDFTIQVLNEHRKLLRFNSASMVKQDGKNQGGCASYRSRKREQEQFAMFQQKWGKQIVRRDGGEGRTHRKKQVRYDVNPIIRVPIGGV